MGEVGGVQPDVAMEPLGRGQRKRLDRAGVDRRREVGSDTIEVVSPSVDRDLNHVRPPDSRADGIGSAGVSRLVCQSPGRQGLANPDVGASALAGTSASSSKNDRAGDQVGA
ncbi:MAG: hypothetical protein AVDCRST_MAG87-652 [uncultured Thermomicrobiales bacterium]|uniref:Uncharacterized protein n=1 Tax=uncultured Thermomicrobiales bacterium TaxID=1645740 RepID=A0A6J4UGU8_9BACT|nr:MAG: hypothetical protein AVDCRST_MAG87-652 [uncultured Thermomicrobiales bacterium]